MKRLILIGLIGCALLPLLSPGVCRAEVTDRIVAIVNDEVVTLREVERFVSVEKKSRFSSMNEYMRNMQIREKLDAFIEGLLINQQAKKLKIEVTDKDIQEAVDGIKKQNMITDDELKHQLKNDNIDYKEFIRGIRMGLTRQKVLAKVIMTEVNLDEKSLKAFYDAHLGDYVQEEYRLHHIFISSRRGDAAERAQEARRELDQGKPFEKVAADFSDEGAGAQADAGFTKKEELIPELREAVALLMPGNYSNVVRTPFGFHLLKLIETKKGDVRPYESVKDAVRAQLFQAEAEKRYKAFIAKLRSSSYIEVKI
jgi:peptidyl-prolyl cis-trans isomerase SurA